MRRLLLVTLLFIPAMARAGLHYSGETFAELPSRWRGFLLDHRSLRMIAARPADAPPSLLRLQYEREATRLTKLGNMRTADETADLGALLVRLGDSARAVEVLRPTVREHPTHYRLVANLGTAWHLRGDLAQAASALEQAVKLAPGKLVRAEELHLKLVKFRSMEKPGTQALDNLFGVNAPPASAIAWTQQLALWLPSDGRLLWRLAEFAQSHGEVATAAAMLDGCVTEFGLRDPTLLERRKLLRAAAEKTTKGDHEDHAGLFKPRSSRPLLSKTGLAALPSIDAKGTNALAWEVLAETTIDRHARPTFAKYLRELDGKQVEIRGHVQPLGENTDLGAFMLIEHPIGCWFCEMPEVANIVLVELPEGKSGKYTRDRVRVTGTLILNATDPENFLYTVKDAKILGDKSE